ncbi:hypothetical protein EDD15DRAFT_2479154 [Pisolithus albus]|nr:hypothetical protein EDD15DRAFT_2479154 [Pisolithus albus]
MSWDTVAGVPARSVRIAQYNAVLWYCPSPVRKLPPGSPVPQRASWTPNLLCEACDLWEEFLYCPGCLIGIFPLVASSVWGSIGVGETEIGVRQTSAWRLNTIASRSSAAMYFKVAGVQDAHVTLGSQWVGSGRNGSGRVAMGRVGSQWVGNDQAGFALGRQWLMQCLWASQTPMPLSGGVALGRQWVGRLTPMDTHRPVGRMTGVGVSDAHATHSVSHWVGNGSGGCIVNVGTATQSISYMYYFKM